METALQLASRIILFSATYFNGQVYTVTLTIHDGVKTATVSKTITVFKKPAITISATPTVGCTLSL